MEPHRYSVTTHDASAFTDDEIAMATRLFNTMEEEVWPEDPVTPLADALAEERAVPARTRTTAVRAWAPDGELVGSVQVRIDPDHDDNPDVLGCQILVRPDHRRRGIGTALLGHVRELARGEGRTRLVGRTYSRIPGGEHFATSVGAIRKAESHTNHLPLAAVDRAQLEAWVRDGPRRAPGYELVAWDGPVPDELLEAFVELLLVMNEAPRDDLEVNDFTLTPAEWREGEAQAAAVGQERWFLVARRASDGELAGLHDVAWVPWLPHAVFVGSTGVRPAHRGHALGKWLKAAMTLRVLEDRPEVTDIRTDNADSNDAMLGINRAMGYRPLLGITTWELAVDP